MNRLKQHSVKNYNSWLNSKRKHDLIADDYPQQDRDENNVKLEANEYYSGTCATIVDRLVIRGFFAHNLHFGHLDGPRSVTSMMLANKLKDVPNCNILVPNFTDAYTSINPSYCTPLFMPIGPIVATKYQSQFPKDVELFNFATLVTSIPLIFAGLWFDYCSAPSTVIEDLKRILLNIKLAPLAIIGVTVSRRQHGCTMDKFKSQVESLLITMYDKTIITSIEQFASKSVMTFFWTIADVENKYNY